MPGVTKYGSGVGVHLQELQLLLPPEAACPPSPRSCSPMRKASGLTAADTAQITAVLHKADLLYDNEVPEQVHARADVKSCDGWHLVPGGTCLAVPAALSLLMQRFWLCWPHKVTKPPVLCCR